jgi:hypothetical protein
MRTALFQNEEVYYAAISTMELIAERYSDETQEPIIPVTKLPMYVLNGDLEIKAISDRNTYRCELPETDSTSKNSKPLPEHPGKNEKPKPFSQRNE